MLKLSIVCVTYNHENFIRVALDSFLKQKTNFKFEVLVGDDCSTDGTSKIVAEYAKKYPDIIKYIHRDQNIGSLNNFIDLCGRVNSDYVALCEGDDYWTDENKLQKQVDFLDKNPDYSVCFHPVNIVWQDKSRPNSIFPKPKHRFGKTTLSIDDLLQRNFIPTCSVMYRWGLKNCEDLFPKNIFPGDWYMHLLHAQVGKIGFISGVMSVYRKHTGGIWYDKENMPDSFILKNAISCLRFYKCVEKQFKCDKEQERLYWVQNAVGAAIRNKDFEFLKTISDMEPDLFVRYLPIRKQTEDFIKRKQYQHGFNMVLVIAIMEMLTIIWSIL